MSELIPEDTSTLFRERLRTALDPRAWFLVAAFGGVLFAAGVYIPALAGFAYAGLWRIVAAIAGGALAMLGVTFGWEGFKEAQGASASGDGPGQPPHREPPTERDRIGPSFEVYSPPEREGGSLLRREPPSSP